MNNDKNFSLPDFIVLNGTNHISNKKIIEILLKNVLLRNDVLFLFLLYFNQTNAHKFWNDASKIEHLNYFILKLTPELDLIEIERSVFDLNLNVGDSFDLINFIYFF